MHIRKLHMTFLAAAVALLAAAPAFSQSELNQGQGKAVVTVLPAKKGAAVPNISASQLALKVDGKRTKIASWKPLQSSNAPIQVVVMIDDGASGNLANQFNDIRGFIKALPTNAEAAVAYMDNGRAKLSGPLSSNHDAVAKELRQPTGVPGISGSPYFCLSDLAHHWPSHNEAARRVVVMVTDGVDNYYVRYNPEDPYVQAAIHDAVRARITVFSIYWRNTGSLDRSWYGTDDGQNLLAQVTQATGGYSYWQGIGNPVTLGPYFKDLNKRLSHQYELSFTAPMRRGPGVARVHLRVTGTDAKIVAPQQVYVGHPTAPKQGT